jgi:1,2-diacylglycerol 3-alpha-glucosyltransferase
MKDNLRIAFYTDSFLPAKDGVVTSVLAYKKELERRGHRVYIFASGNDDSKRIAAGRKDVYIVKSIKFKKYPQYNIALFPFSTTAKTYRRMDIDIIHAHTPFSMGAAALVDARLKKVPLVSTFHTLFSSKYVIREYMPAGRITEKILSKYAWEYARFFYNRCDAVISPSETMTALLKRHSIAGAHTVPNGIDLLRFSGSHRSSGRLRNKLTNGNRKAKVILYLGRISREKRIETLIKAAHGLRKSGQNAVVIVAGTGPALNYYKNIASRMGLDKVVRFVGFVPDRQVPAYYAACDVFCLPSTFETQGIAAIEALASGKPVVAADSLALTELIKNGRNGEKFRPGDWRGCERKIEKVINHSASYKEMESTAQKFSIESVTDRLLDVYRDVLDNFDNN